MKISWKIKRHQLFLFLYAIYILQQVYSETTITSYTTVDLLLTLVRYATMVGFLVLAVIRNIGASMDYLVLMIILGLGSLGLVINGSGISIIIFVFILLTARDCPLESIFKVTIYALIISHISVVLMCFTGILKDVVATRYLGSYAGSYFEGLYERHKYGFLVANQLPITLLFVYLLEIIRKKGKISAIENLIFAFLNVLLFQQCGARTIFILLFFAMGLSYLIRVKGYITKKDSSFVYGITSISFILAGALSFIAAYSYGTKTSLAKYLNLFFNNRLSYAYIALQKYGFSLFGFGRYAGTNAEMLTSRVDNGYIIFYLQQGIFVWLFVIGLLTYLMYFSSKQKNGFVWLALFIISIECLINAHLMSYRMLPLYCILMNKSDDLLKVSALPIKEKYMSKIRIGFRRGLNYRIGK